MYSIIRVTRIGELGTTLKNGVFWDVTPCGSCKNRHKPGVPLRPIVSTIGSPTYRLSQHLASLISGHTGHSPHDIKNSIEFVQVLSSFQVDTHDVTVFFDIVSLFTKVPKRGTMDLLGRHFEEDVLGIFCHVLTTSYFTFNGQFYGQTDGVTMGSPLSLVIANFYIVDYDSCHPDDGDATFLRNVFSYKSHTA
jgi:hypothetical protein